jgi:hypothetical protein
MASTTETASPTPAANVVGVPAPSSQSRRDDRAWRGCAPHLPYASGLITLNFIWALPFDVANATDGGECLGSIHDTTDRRQWPTQAMIGSHTRDRGPDRSERTRRAFLQANPRNYRLLKTWRQTILVSQVRVAWRP